MGSELILNRTDKKIERMNTEPKRAQFTFKSAYFGGCEPLTTYTSCSVMRWLQLRFPTSIRLQFNTFRRPFDCSAYQRSLRSQ